MKGGEGWGREGVTLLGRDRWSVACNSLLQRRAWAGQESVRFILRKRVSVPLSSHPLRLRLLESCKRPPSSPLSLIQRPGS